MIKEVACLILLAQGISGFMPFWYPILTKSRVRNIVERPILVKIMGVPLVAYKKDQQLILHQDMCPHAGASFANGGWVADNIIYCPYHGFGFDEGKMFNSKKSIMPVHKVLEKNGFFYTCLSSDPPHIEPYYPPEHYNSSFVKISGQRLLSCNVDAVVENLLDMLHISYVHSFGNFQMPLARNIKYEDIHDYGGKTTFEYTPNQLTISTQVGGTDTVIVENEFYMPTTTLTRVKAGPITKTVFTQSLPIDKSNTILFWSVYRNFWIDPYVPSFTTMGDNLLRTLMEKTIDEDVSILSKCYPEGRIGFLTKYDITIRNYRRLVKYYTTNQ